MRPGAGWATVGCNGQECHRVGLDSPEQVVEGVAVRGGQAGEELALKMTD